MGSVTGPGTILGGLPVMARISFGVDYGPDSSDAWAEVQEIFWRRRDGRPGKAIPSHLWLRAEKYDPYFSTLTEEVGEWAAGLEPDRHDEGL